MVEVNTFNELQRKLSRVIETQFGMSAFVTEIFLNKREFIFELKDKFTQVQYEIDASGEVVLGESIEVERKVTFPKVG